MISARYPLARLSLFGVTSLRRYSPFMIAWWSAAFPGFGHFLLNQYLRATFLTLSEVAFNTLAHINEAMVMSFCGHFDQAKAILEPRWTSGYVVVFCLSIWDSYRSAIYQNKLCLLADYENAAISNMRIYPSEILYVQPKNPRVAAVFSLLFPGFGQLYNHRIGLAFYAITWWWIFITLSHVNESVIYILTGRIKESVPFLRPHWLLFMPSVIGGSIYHAYTNAKEQNRLFNLEQRQYLLQRFGVSDVLIFRHQRREP